MDEKRLRAGWHGVGWLILRSSNDPEPGLARGESLCDPLPGRVLGGMAADSLVGKMADQFSAGFEAPFVAGPPTGSPAVRVRDLIVCATDASDEVPIDELYEHPPIGGERYPGLDDDRGEWVEKGKSEMLMRTIDKPSP